MTTRYTADLHFRHRNIITFCDRPFKKDDGQPDVELMDTRLIEYWNETVKPDDETYIIGDVFFGSASKRMREYLDKMNGKKYLIRGNHDRHTDKAYLDAGFERVEKHLWVDGYLLIHKPEDAHPWARVGEFEGTSDNSTVVLCGHVHEQWAYTNCVERYPTNEKMWAHFYNVGVDKRNFRPVTLEELGLGRPR